MKVDIRFEITGDKEFKDRLNRLITQSPAKVDEKLDETASDVERDAKQIVPKKSGTLRDSIQKKKVSKLHYIIGAYAPYAGWVERGHHTFPGVAFMEEATRQNEAKLKDKLLEAISETK